MDLSTLHLSTGDLTQVPSLVHLHTLVLDSCKLRWNIQTVIRINIALYSLQEQPAWLSREGTHRSNLDIKQEWYCGLWCSTQCKEIRGNGHKFVIWTQFTLNYFLKWDNFHFSQFKSIFEIFQLFHNPTWTCFQVISHSFPNLSFVSFMGNPFHSTLTAPRDIAAYRSRGIIQRIMCLR